MSDGPARMAAVIIGRNEGSRLVACLRSVADRVDRLVYVDSGSEDGSIAAAQAVGAEVVELDPSRPFTAARARNAGIEALAKSEMPEFVQFIDGDCELRSGWVEQAVAFLSSRKKAAVAFGRLRERHPEVSVFNRLCDHEWDGPAGISRSCGGIALMRSEALIEVSGFNPALIAGEEPELCVRMRARGWEIWRLEAEMALHDAAMTRFGQWWKRARRGGYASAEGFAMHGAAPERHGAAAVRRALAWGLLLPAIAFFGAFATLWSLALLLAYPAQVIRLALRDRVGKRPDWETGLFLVLAKFPETLGVLDYGIRRLVRRPSGLIEYK